MNMANSEVIARFIGVATEHDIIPADEAKGKAPQVFVRLRVTEGDDAGRELPWYGSLKEGKAQEITFKQLRAMGWQDNDVTKLTGLGSTKVEITETQDEYPAGSGKLKSRFMVWAFRGERGDRPQLRDEDKKDFARRYKALAASVEAIPVTEVNSAPAELPPARTRNTAAGGPPASGPAY